MVGAVGLGEAIAADQLGDVEQAALGATSPLTEAGAHGSGGRGPRGGDASDMGVSAQRIAEALGR